MPSILSHTIIQYLNVIRLITTLIITYYTPASHSKETSEVKTEVRTDAMGTPNLLDILKHSVIIIILYPMILQ